MWSWVWEFRVTLNLSIDLITCSCFPSKYLNFTWQLIDKLKTNATVAAEAALTDTGPLEVFRYSAEPILSLLECCAFDLVGERTIHVHNKSVPRYLIVQKNNLDSNIDCFCVFSQWQVYTVHRPERKKLFLRKKFALPDKGTQINSEQNGWISGDTYYLFFSIRYPRPVTVLSCTHTRTHTHILWRINMFHVYAAVT